MIPEMIQRIYELRYEGYEYTVIHEKMKEEFGDKFGLTLGSLRNYMGPAGIYYPGYLKYANEQGEIRYRSATTKLRKESEAAAQAIIDVFKQAVADKNNDRIVELAKLIMSFNKPEDDKGRENDPNSLKGLSNAQLRELIEQNGLNADAILGPGADTKKEN